MPQIVTTATNTNTAVDDDTLNPAQTANRKVVHVTLIFDGVTFTPNDLYDALDAQWGTVSGEKDANGYSHGIYIFNIST